MIVLSTLPVTMLAMHIVRLRLINKPFYWDDSFYTIIGASIAFMIIAVLAVTTYEIPMCIVGPVP